MNCPTCTKTEAENYFQDIRNRLSRPNFKFNFNVSYRQVCNISKQGTMKAVTGIYDELKRTSDQLKFWVEAASNDTVILPEEEIFEICPGLLLDFYEWNLSFIELDGSVRQVGRGCLTKYERIVLEHVPKEIHYVKYEDCQIYYLTSWHCESLPRWVPSAVLRVMYPELLTGYLKKIICMGVKS